MPEVIDLTARDDLTNTRVEVRFDKEWFVGDVLRRLERGTVVQSNDQVLCTEAMDAERASYELQGPFWHEVNFDADGVQMAIDLDPDKKDRCWRRLCEPMAGESDSSESDSDKTSTNGYELSASSSDFGESDDSDDEQGRLLLNCQGDI